MAAQRSKVHSTIWYSQTAYKLLKLLAEDLGVKQTDVVEMAIRDLAKKRKIALPSEEDSANGNEG